MTIVSIRVWETLDRSSSALTTFDQIVSTASGSPIEVGGKTNVQLTVADSSCYVDVIVANIDNEVIMGLDFLKNMNCKIDVAQGTLVIQGQTIKLDSLGYVGCSRIIASEMVQIPPRSEKIIRGKMVESTLENGRHCTIESSEYFFISVAPWLRKL